jgi:hypothetical protein
LIPNCGQPCYHSNCRKHLHHVVMFLCKGLDCQMPLQWRIWRYLLNNLVLGFYFVLAIFRFVNDNFYGKNRCILFNVNCHIYHHPPIFGDFITFKPLALSLSSWNLWIWLQGKGYPNVTTRRYVHWTQWLHYTLKD